MERIEDRIEYLDEPRALSEAERTLVEFLLDEPFPGNDALRRQLPTLTVSGEHVDGSGTITFTPERSPEMRAGVRTHVPVIARGTDADGMFLEVLLHVADGYLEELELWRGDLKPIHSLPMPSALKSREAQ